MGCDSTLQPCNKRPQGVEDAFKSRQFEPIFHRRHWERQYQSFQKQRERSESGIEASISPLWGLEILISRWMGRQLEPILTEAGARRRLRVEGAVSRGPQDG